MTPGEYVLQMSVMAAPWHTSQEDCESKPDRCFWLFKSFFHDNFLSFFFRASNNKIFEKKNFLQFFFKE